MSEILKKVYINADGDRILSYRDLHKKVDAFKYNQDKASKKWEIQHDLNTTGVQLQVLNDIGEVIIPKEVIINDSFSVTITFVVNQTGKAIIVGNVLP